MSLSPPIIIGLLSEASDAIRLTGQTPGGTIFVFRNDVDLIAKRPASAFDEVFSFDPGVVLAAGDRIGVEQHAGGEQSFRTPAGSQLKVLRVNPPFTGHRFNSHIYRCGRSLFLGGLVPGGEVQLSVGGSLRGSARSIDSGAVVRLSPATNPNEQIEARQVVKGVVGPPLVSYPADEPPQLNNFWFSEAMACAPGLKTFTAVDGAVVKIQRRAGDPSTEVDFDAPIREMFFPVGPLTLNQHLQAEETLDLHCERQSFPSDVRVGPMRFDKLPRIVGPQCEGTTRIQLADLVIGADVEARQGADMVGRLVAWNEKLDMDVSPLAGGVDLVVGESLCGASADSLPKSVDALPAAIPPCSLVEPVFDCVMTLFLTGVHLGAYLTAFSKERGQLCSPKKLLVADADLPLDLAVQAGEHVWVEQAACGGLPIASNGAEVKPLPDLDLPVLERPLFWDHPNVLVRHCLPGAVVHLYTQEQGFISAGTADRHGEARLARSTVFAILLPGQHVLARQLLCTQVSHFSAPEEVIDRTPLAPILQSPPLNSVGAAQRPHLTWTDPGKGTFREAAKFLVELTDATIPSFSAWRVREVVTTTDLAVGVDLPFSTKEIWRVTSIVGDPGWEVSRASSVGTFTVQAPPPPPPPPPPPGGIPPTTMATFSKVALRNCHSSHRSLDIFARDLTKGEDYTHIAGLASQYDENGFCPAAGSTPVEIPLTDKHWHEIVALDADMPGCVIDPGDPVDPHNASCWREHIVVLASASGPVLSVIVS